VIALEAGRILDATILPDFESWDIRRYSDTRIAIKILAASERGDSGGTITPSALSGEPDAAERTEDDPDE
jgi:hypothetical protein